MKLTSLTMALLFSVACHTNAQEEQVSEIELFTTDIDNFWEAFDKADPEFDPNIFQELYLNRGSKGIQGFTKGRIESAENLAKVIKAHPNYYRSVRESTLKVSTYESQIEEGLKMFKGYYPEANFPPVYFVVGALNSGGTASRDGLIIGAEMYGLTPDTPKEELGGWLKTVISSVDKIPHIVSHELVHYSQNINGDNLLAACLREGSADFIAELVSGRHINDHVHEFANPKEEELWLEFKEKMHENDFKGWLYSSVEGRPNDLGYWMGYKITKAYFDKIEDKKKAFRSILNISDTDQFLKESGYEEKFSRK